MIASKLPSINFTNVTPPPPITSLKVGENFGEYFDFFKEKKYFFTELLRMMSEA